MRKNMIVVGMTCALALACASMGNVDAVRAAALQTIGVEQIADNASNRPAELIELKSFKAHVDSIEATSPTAATVLTTYKYKGRFNTGAGEKSGMLTIQRKLQYTKNGDVWSQNGAAEEVARKTSWSGAKQS